MKVAIKAMDKEEGNALRLQLKVSYREFANK